VNSTYVKSVSVIQQPVMPRHVCSTVLYSSLFCLQMSLLNSSLCCLWTSLLNSSLCCLGRVCFIQQSVLPVDVSVLQQPVLPLDVSLLQQTVLPSYISVLHQPVMQPELHLDVFVQQTVLPGGVSPKAACAVIGFVCLQELLCEPMVPVFESLCCTYERLSIRPFFCTWMCLSSKACAALMNVRLEDHFSAPGCVCLQKPVLHLCMSASKIFVLHMDVFVYKSLCCTSACPSTRAFVMHPDMSIYTSLCCTCACLSTRALSCTLMCLPTRAQPILYLQDTMCFCSLHIFLFVLICFKTGKFFKVVSIHVRNTKFNRRSGSGRPINFDPEPT